MVIFMVIDGSTKLGLERETVVIGRVRNETSKAAVEDCIEYVPAEKRPVMDQRAHL